MIDIEDVIKQVSKRTGVDVDTVSTICKSIFQNVVQTMKDDTDTRDILFNELFKFKLKSRFKDNKQKEYTAR